MNGAVTRDAAARMEKTARLRPYFDLQLRFAETMADATKMPLARSVTVNTNLHRRFGFGRIRDGQYAPEWETYLRKLAACGNHTERLEATCVFFLHCPDEEMPPNEAVFGCFSFEPPDTRGAVRIHFGNRSGVGEAGPLSRGSMSVRLGELREMFAHIGVAHPNAALVRGGSWLYRIDAYRRLFPEAYVKTCAPAHGLMRFDGTSSWGQFLNRHGGVKPELRDIFLRNLQRLDPSRPEETFPLPAMRAEAPIGLFYDFYGIQTGLQP